MICLHILGGGFELIQLFCGALASKGVPAIMFQLPFYGERSPPEGRGIILENPQVFQMALVQATDDARRAVDLLSSRPEIDPSKIGVMGISMGGIMAGSLVGLEPRINRAGLLLSGGDLPKIISHARETRRINQILSTLLPQDQAAVNETLRRMDPLTHAEALSKLAKEGRVLMINAGEDEVVPRDCSRRLAEAIGIGADRLVVLDGLGHYTAMAALGDAVERTVSFFSEDTPPSAKPPRAVPAASAAVQDPAQSAAAVLQQLADIIFQSPSQGQCNIAKIKATIKKEGTAAYDGELLFIRGWGNRFRLEGNVPKVGVIAIGQGDFPWMAMPGKRLFAGTVNPVEDQNPLAFASQRGIVRARMLQGLAAAASLGALSLDKLVTIKQEKAADGSDAIVLNSPQKQFERICLGFRPDGRTPERIEFAAKGFTGTLTFQQWQVNAIGQDELFVPPNRIPRQEVDQGDLQRSFSAVFNLLVERTE